MDGVSDACLNLQNSYGMDVNMMLFCCWYGLTYGAIDTRLLQQSLEASRVWSAKTVKPIRDVRLWLKDIGCSQYSFDTDTCKGYRDRIKAVELEAEKIQQLTLESLCREKADNSLSDQSRIVAIAKNLKAYLSAETIQPTKPVIRGLESIIQASLQDFDSAIFSKNLLD